jgi:tetratricopeptide (TPR) repeat protein
MVMAVPDFFEELRRRRVLPVAGAYIAIAWLITEITSFFLEQAGAPPWGTRLTAIVFVVGFPVAIVLAWIIQVRPDGKRALDSSKGQGRTVAAAVLLGILATAGLAWLILPRMEDAELVESYQPFPHSLAVLPINTTTGTRNERTIADTLYTVLVDGLGQSQKLTLINLPVEGLPADLVSFGRQFRVAHLLSGNLQRSSGSTRVQLQLLDVAEKRIRWAETIPWDPVRIMEVGTKISNAILDAMALPRISQQNFVGTESREAYEAYLLGQKHGAVWNAENVAIALEHFERAMQHDPGYVRGQARLASAYLFHGLFSSASRAEQQAWKEKARAAAERALELDSGSADAISVLGRVAEDPELEAQLYQRALELDPDHDVTLQRYAVSILKPAGDFKGAAELLERLVDRDPLEANNLYELGTVKWELGYKDEAIALLERAMELQPDMMQTYHTLGYWMTFEYGRLDEAVLLHRMSYSVNPETGHEAAPVAQSYAALGMREEALTFIAKALEILDWRADVIFMAAHTHERLGDDERAHEYWLRFVDEMGDRTHPEMVQILARNDLREGRYEDALRRFREAMPAAILDGTQVDAENVVLKAWYGYYLQRAGYSDEARRRLESAAAFAESFCAETEEAILRCRLLPWWVYAALGDKAKTLEWLRYAIIEKRYFANNQYLNHAPLDFLRDDPEFLEIMAYLDAEMEQQRARIREMECAGDMPPAPGIDTAAFCP